MTIDYKSLGLMSGTSGDGVDASIIQSDGAKKYKVLVDKYFKYSQTISSNIHNLKRKINSHSDIKKFSEEIKVLERDITIFHAKSVIEIINESKINIDFIGFHGQTIFHDSQKKLSFQLGDGKLLSQLVKKDVIFDFRQNDINKGGEGAPLSPIFHKLISDQYKLNLPLCFLNIGGIANITLIQDKNFNNLISRDIGPGNCMIDEWVRNNSKFNYDKDGRLSQAGTTNKIVLEQVEEFFLKNIEKQSSLDTKDFDISFVRGLSLEDGASTLTDFTAQIIVSQLHTFIGNDKSKNYKILLCGGGRKNKNLINKIKEIIASNFKVELIDKYDIDGDFVESQAFAYLAIRSLLKLPISFPNTTGCSEPSTGGIFVKY